MFAVSSTESSCKISRQRTHKKILLVAIRHKALSACSIVLLYRTWCCKLLLHILSRMICHPAVCWTPLISWMQYDTTEPNFWLCCFRCGWYVFSLALLPLNCLVFTARCTLVQSMVLPSYVVRPSVCPCVTFRYCDHIGWNSSKIISRPNSLGPVWGLTPTWAIWCNGNTPKIGAV